MQYNAVVSSVARNTINYQAFTYTGPLRHVCSYTLDKQYIEIFEVYTYASALWLIWVWVCITRIMKNEEQ